MTKAFQMVGHKIYNTISDEKHIRCFYNALGNKIANIHLHIKLKWKYIYWTLT